MTIQAAGRSWLLATLGAVLAVLVAGSLMLGYVAIPLTQVWAALFAQESTPHSLIVQELRLPRTLLGVAVGASLGIAGAGLQGLLRNPLAEPGVLGISNTAALGAVATIYTGIAASVPLALPAAAMAGALLSMLVLYGLAGREANVQTLILAGVAISSLAGALISVALNLAPSAHATTEILFWLLGSLADRGMNHVQWGLPFMAAGVALLLSAGRALDALSMGEETARSLGFNLNALRFRVIAGATLAVGAGVAVSGSIGFVGLVVPHLLRPLVGYQPARLLPASALGGAILLLLADMGLRLASGQVDLKLGVVTALVGAPFFLHLVLKTRRMTI
ncbi:FecCD family ABC transporter permease [Thiohalorhabdus methylotrophus]|uniref:FecCD family ABC transporter permease n=1 Tax=Thiohalorhabdus methylotrophus TaxID=3242694 RepID=A0ABV4TT28_9GAMM